MSLPAPSMGGPTALLADATPIGPGAPGETNVAEGIAKRARSCALIWLVPAHSSGPTSIEDTKGAHAGLAHPGAPRLCIAGPNQNTAQALLARPKTKTSGERRVRHCDRNYWEVSVPRQKHGQCLCLRCWCCVWEKSAGDAVLRTEGRGSSNVCGPTRWPTGNRISLRMVKILATKW